MTATYALRQDGALGLCARLHVALAHFQYI
jgi:hypothetical protein